MTVRQNFLIKKSQLESLRKIRELNGTPISWQVRKALEEYLEKILYGDENKDKTNN